MWNHGILHKWIAPGDLLGRWPKVLPPAVASNVATPVVFDSLHGHQLPSLPRFLGNSAQISADDISWMMSILEAFVKLKSLSLETHSELIAFFTILLIVLVFLFSGRCSPDFHTFTAFIIQIIIQLNLWHKILYIQNVPSYWVQQKLNPKTSTLPKTSSSHLKIDGGKTSFILERPKGLFSGEIC